ncbi:MAG: chromosome segregation protein SMC [Spirulina sp. SIO3F2]|nr:chromosome segregation protein SMC [Spirulina sp. SIO3F2]
MVHIKRVALSHFKSFGGTVDIPLLEGFTVVSGPNGSGKSNILDGLLFCLGLASSKGMRADRLPDLVNHNQLKKKGTAEVNVVVTFDLGDWQDDGLYEGEQTDNTEEVEVDHAAILAPRPGMDWTISRRLRVTKSGGYSSFYAINGEACTASELHEQLRRLRIYPEGYNVVLQGDVTRIISMNSRERREIIDELAGVAEFDRKINQVRRTFEDVQEREGRCEIIQQELQRSLDKLAADRLKAEKYQKLRAQIQEKKQWALVIEWRSLKQQLQTCERQIFEGDEALEALIAKLSKLSSEIATTQAERDRLDAQVKSLGEEQQLELTRQLTEQRVERNQQQKAITEQQQLIAHSCQAKKDLTQQMERDRAQLKQLTAEQTQLKETQLGQLQQACKAAQVELEQRREQASAVAAESEAWVQQQKELSQAIAALQQDVNPQQTEQARLQDRCDRLTTQITEAEAQLVRLDAEIAEQDAVLKPINVADLESKIQNLAAAYAEAEEERNLAIETQRRLLSEQRDRQRQLDRLEAQTQAQQEAQGTQASKVIMQANLPGVCGLVAELGQVEKRYQIALEIAAGGRLGCIVVEDDGVASEGIALLKQRRAGRATFLPLNKIRAPRSNRPNIAYARGFVDFAVNLVDCSPRYEQIFAYVFGTTVVFEDLQAARAHLGKVRIVTLEGELLESSGAMTGGSRNQRSSLHFGNVSAAESPELQKLRQRLEEITFVLGQCEGNIAKHQQQAKAISEELAALRQTRATEQLRYDQATKERDRALKQQEQTQAQLSQYQTELGQATTRLAEIAKTLPRAQAELAAKQAQLNTLETDQATSEWQAVQQQIKAQEATVQECDRALRAAENQLRELDAQILRIQERCATAQTKLTEERDRQAAAQNQIQQLQTQSASLDAAIQKTEAAIAQLNETLGTAKQERDRSEKRLRKLQDQQQSTTWQRQKRQEQQQELQQQRQALQIKLTEHTAELPDPLPEVPNLVNPADSQATNDSESYAQQLERLQNPVSFETHAAQLEHLQRQLHNMQRRLEAMEPVNMLALEEYEQTEKRYQELTEKLKTLAEERTELLLRIEKFTTLRLRAFRTAFDAVNENFQTIFATLSQGDGYLDLDNADDPFGGGLNLIAHPKGKPVQRLSSMSGGEKSLTALSFIFALQRYRPSPFYAFDEVDMFLDGANVERLAKMIKQQAEQAQFLVVSLRRPMIESSQRTIGVTQARGAYTQVLGIQL